MAVDKITGIKIKKNDGTYSAEIPISVQLENVIGAGTAAAKDVPASGNASTSQVVMGSDTRLTNARPASDVSAWAKASTKPSYTASEVGAIASTLKGAASGVAELDSAGKVPSSQLPSYVDDVLEYDAKSSFPSTGEAGKIYVDKSTNLTYRWSGTAYVEISPSLALGTTSSTAFRGDYGNTAYNHATNKGSAYTSGMYKITTNSEGHVTAATAIQKSDITGLGIPGQDTTYSVATTSANGLMSSTDKTKLNGIATGAEVNQNAFSNVKVGSTTIEADSKTDTLELAAGSNITLTPDATGDKVTIAATDTTYGAATTSAAGLMSAADKTKLNGIAAGAQVNTVTSVAGKTGAVTLAKSDVGLGNVDNTADSAKSVAYAANAGKVNNHTVNADVPSGAKFTDTTYSNATTSTAGLMSSSDKSKLDGIAAGAQVNTVTSVAGKTGAVTLTKSDVGLGNVGNFKAVSTAANQGLTEDEKANARANIGAGASSFDGTWASLSGKPTLGTASAKDVASSGNASSTQVVMGNDTRLTNSRPASDVSSWAKASSKPSYTASEVGAIASSLKGAASGVAELDANGKVPSSQLPSYVDDVLEYNTKSSFPSTGETGKIYVDTSTNLTYRWSGSAYVEISPSLALGTTSSTAYRGDYGNTAYSHATDSSRLTTAKSSGLYKIATTAQGHVASVTAVTKSDITGLGIPAQDTTYSDATTSTHGLMSTSDKSKLDGIAAGAQVNAVTSVAGKTGAVTLAKGDVGLGNVDNTADSAKSVAYAANAGKVNNHTVNADVPSGAKFTDTTYTAASATPNMNGTGAVGTSAKYAREDHVHPSDTSRVPTTRKINNKTLNADISLTASDVGAAATDHTHSADNITGGYLNIHPENSPTIIPFLHNDIAHMLKRGGSAIIKYDGVTKDIDLTNVFDGSGTYWKTDPSSISTIVIELTLYKVFTWTNTIYADFGDSSWRAKNIKIEVVNTNYSNDAWSEKFNVTNNTSGHVYVEFDHQPSGASNAGGGFNKIRFTFSSWARSNIFRISQLGIYNYGSFGLRETYMSRGSDDPLFRDLTPNTNNLYNIGSSNNYWKNGYFTNINGVAVGSSPKFTDTTYSDATTSAHGLMTAADKTKLNGIASGAEVNQNAFSNVKVGSTTIAADGKTDTLELVAGSNITLTPDASGDKVTIAATGGGGDDYLIADDAGSAASTNPINADQLNGHPASYFLTSGDIVDGLNSTSTTDALSANQGRILYSDISNLQTAVVGKASASDVTALQTAVAGKADTASPAFTGDATVAASTNYSTAKLRNVILSTSEPTAADGNNGDIWIVYGS